MVSIHHLHALPSHGLVEALASKKWCIDTPLSIPGQVYMIKLFIGRSYTYTCILVEALAIKSGGIDTRIHDFPGLVEALAIKSGGVSIHVYMTFLVVSIHIHDFLAW